MFPRNGKKSEILTAGTIIPTCFYCIREKEDPIRSADVNSIGTADARS